MAELKIIWTNNAIAKMKAWQLTEAEVTDAFNHGETEWSDEFKLWNAIKKYPGREVGVSYNNNEKGQWVIISVWKRQRR